MRKYVSMLVALMFAICISSCSSKTAQPAVDDQQEAAPAVEEQAQEEAPVQEEVAPVDEEAQAIKNAIEEAAKNKQAEFKLNLEKLVKQSVFEFNSDKIAESNYKSLDIVANFLKDNSNVSVKVIGHTDNIGTQEYNKDLSQRRAQSVANYFIEKGVDSSKVSVEGLGFAEPIADNSTAEGRAQNRRTELKFSVLDIPVEDAVETAKEIAK